MSKRSSSYQPLSPVELLARRVQIIVSSPTAQLQREAVITREPHEPFEAWAQLLEQISLEDNVTMTRRSADQVHLAWQPILPD